jgi:hypothetical protein
VNLCVQCPQGTLQYALPALQLLLSCRLLLAFPRFLLNPRRAREDPGRSEVNRIKLDSVVAQIEFAYLVGVRHASRFKNLDKAIAFPVRLDILQLDPGIHQGRQVYISGFETRGVHQRRE